MHLDERPISILIFDRGIDKIVIIDDITADKFPKNIKEKWKWLTNDNLPYTYEFKLKYNSKSYLCKILGIEESSVPEYYPIKVPIYTQIRKHKKKRINKKWRKKYKYKQDYVWTKGLKLQFVSDGTYEFVKGDE